MHWTDIRGGWINRPTDGVVANEGAVWDAPLATVLETGASVLTWDLGQVVPVRALWVQGDANDYYTIWGSVDGNRYQDLGRVEPAEGVHGLRGRKVSLGGVPVRYLRIGEGQGDSFYSISEVQAFCELPAAFPPSGAGGAGRGRGRCQEPVDLLERREPRSGVELFLALLGWGCWPGASQLKREGRPDAYKRLRDRALAALGVIAGLCYINFGSFHFGNFTHDWEWTHYYVGSKYFKQLSYDRLYECIAIADSEESAHLRKRVELRKLTNLRTNALEPSKYAAGAPRGLQAELHPAALGGVQERRPLLPQPAERQALGRSADRPRLQRHPGLERGRHAAGQHRPGQRGTAVCAGHAGPAVPAGHHRRHLVGVRLARAQRGPAGVRHQLPLALLLDRGAVTCAGTGCSI